MSIWPGLRRSLPAPAELLELEPHLGLIRPGQVELILPFLKACAGQRSPGQALADLIVAGRMPPPPAVRLVLRALLVGTGRKVPRLSEAAVLGSGDPTPRESFAREDEEAA